MIGIDLVEHNRFLEMKEELLTRILSDLELEQLSLITSDIRKISYLASRFAGKEAIFKAYKKGTGTLNYRDISILNHDNGEPYVLFFHNIMPEIQISISHSEHYSIAMVLLQS